MIYWIAYYACKLISLVYCPFKVQGRKHIPSKGPFIFASNHLSNLDPFLIGLCVHRRINYVAKDSLFKTQLSNFFLRQVGAFPIKRQASDIRSLRESIRRLKAGMPLVVFPEGTRKSAKSNDKVYTGIGFLSAKTGVPIIPVKIEGTDKVLPPGGRWLRRNRVNIKIGAPVHFDPQTPYPDITQNVMDAIDSLT